MERSYSHIDLDERRKIARWRTAGLSVGAIAEQLGRHRSTIFREIKRNTFVDKVVPDLTGYYCVTAHDMSCERRAKLRKLVRFSHVRQSVIDRIIHGWSPQQIAGRMRLERHPISVSHETIYKFAYSSDGQAIKLWRHLPEHRARRRPRHARRKHGQRFSPELNILRRPDAVAGRKQFGHWECDLIQFRKKFGKANVTSLVERVSRFAIFLRNNDRQSRPVMNGLVQALQALPHLARRSITFDRGTEFTDWPYLQASIGTQTWFCDPQSPWQKGTVENTNKRVRRYLPAETIVLEVTNQEIRSLCDRLNNTPRKCLGFQTPKEMFSRHILALERNGV
ncbi:IS30 family transposase (plasmid) [Agrobacterium tumefaciens]|jgi:IS30 family transposase|uniref:IS30 family transposase n=1 Tax=Agrobacterium tumefaciens TaxID=358 RepID=UPI0015730EC2|nr:IS30 family transposase [Agrobacterium tumefaciens]NSZ76959.1 IS30 family transposase [Agrobacterium tumefaciens]NSZ87439.1 IS30 family transposase [Agrobacterium tumefaciens]WCA72667.1 IS30 family transposase [Agrobacterium tumefaciens]